MGVYNIFGSFVSEVNPQNKTKKPNNRIQQHNIIS